ncbi:MAG TPA: hypothetical protein VEI52_14770 [Terriglobales bacterium]|nr:hypothetical protein [Terriglobales bacterium]
MGRVRSKSSGFTLITTLMLLFLLTGLAIGMLMMVNTEVKVGTQDVQNNVTFHAAEGAIEKMTSDLANLFTNTLSPSPTDISSLGAAPGPPTFSGITFPGYTLAAVTNAAGKIAETPAVVASGPYAGLNAETMQVNLTATAQGLLGDEVQMARTVEVALIPVFQFGVFSDGDLAFFNNPNLTFNGSIHTNGDLYLGCAAGNNCTFTSKITVYGNVIRAFIPNGLTSASINNAGNVNIPGEPGGCSGNNECTTLPTAGNLWGSVTGAGGNPPASGYNSGPPTWVTISQNSWTAANGYLGGMMINGNYGNAPNTGATNLSLPFVAGALAGATPGLGNPPGPQNYEIVRRPPTGESTTSPLGASRLYNEAAVRVLLSDKPEELPGGAADPDNIRLANMLNSHGTGVNYSTGVATAQPNLAAPPAGETYVTYFATASALVPDPSTAQVVSESGTSYFAATADQPYSPKTALGEFSNEFDGVDEGAVGFPYLFSNGWSQTKAPNVINICVASTCTASPPAYPYYTPPVLNTNTASDTQWNLIDGYLRVEMLPTSGACPGPGAQVNGYCAVTREWLGLGFARGAAPPTTPGFPWAGAATQNSVNPYAILLFQQPKRTTSAAPNMTGTSPTCTLSHGSYTCHGTLPDVVKDYSTPNNNPYQGLAPFVAGNTDPTVTAFNWYPINFYDAREGEPSDTITGDNSCTPLGVMNAVELDVGNLAQWLAGNIGTTGSLVNYTNQNGYIFYFSDRRGMLPNPNGTQTVPAGQISGDAGFEDVVNASTANRAPDGSLEPIPAGKTISPEDANLNGLLDNFGAQNLGLGLGYVGANYTATNSVNYLVNNPAPADPYLVGNRIAQCSVAQNVWTSGARHVLKLVDGGMSNAGVTYLPHMPVAYASNWGGFTVGSENPVYVYGDYNTFDTDTAWNSPSVDENPAAAGIVADTITLLSKNWVDWNSILSSPTQPSGNRVAATTYYRMALASGDVQAFPHPAWASGNQYPIGTDGGVGNFLRFLETWNGQTLNYIGSMVNLYFSTYNTGIFKCCNYAVYSPPTRNYNFDTDFTTFQNLPPGTPMFRDIDNLSYRQSFTPCTVGANGLCTN